MILKLMEDLIHDQNIAEEKLNKISFFKEHLNLLERKQIRYSADTLISSSSLYFTFPGAYKMIQKSKLFMLHHPKYLINKFGDKMTTGVTELDHRP
jgi:hypothetical protein